MMLRSNFADEYAKTALEMSLAVTIPNNTRMNPAPAVYGVQDASRPCTIFNKVGSLKCS